MYQEISPSNPNLWLYLKCWKVWQPLGNIPNILGNN